MAQQVVAGRYRLLRPLGWDGTGTVWLGQDDVADRHVAIRVLRAPAGASDHERAAFRHRAMEEARSSPLLAQSNVFTLHDVLSGGAGDDDAVYLILDFIAGVTLPDLIRPEGPPAGMGSRHLLHGWRPETPTAGPTVWATGHALPRRHLAQATAIAVVLIIAAMAAIALYVLRPPGHAAGLSGVRGGGTAAADLRSA